MDQITFTSAAVELTVLPSVGARVHSLCAFGLRAVIRSRSRTSFVVAASPSELDAIAVETQTNAPQGVRRLVNGEPGAMALLPADGTLTLTTGLTFELDQQEEAK